LANISPEQTKDPTDQILQSIRERNESYLSTIYALHGFFYAVRKNFPAPTDEMFLSIGRRMNYASGYSKAGFCTPDLVIQLNKSEGIVGEAKLLVCQNVDDHWNKYIKQLKRYDADLVGWWADGEMIDHTNLVWITEIGFSAQIGDYFLAKIDSGEVQFQHPFAVVEFSKIQKAREFLFLRTRMGTMPLAIEKAFKDGIHIPLETLLLQNNEKKFYDAKPQDVEYIMEILWQNIFNREAMSTSSKQTIYNSKEKIWQIPVTIDELTTELQKLYGADGKQNREVQYPQITWVREALNKFVSINLAKRGQADREYIILFRKFSKPLEKFINLSRKKGRKKQSSEEQLELFPLSNEEPAQ
jgi:hypothetical protein